jgi:hypothetical protein
MLWHGLVCERQIHALEFPRKHSLGPQNNPKSLGT